MDTIRVLVSGAAGKMGQELVRAIHWEEDLKLVGACDVSQVGVEVGQMCGIDL
ncbi:MAG: 4-hydroxy-tetrahydrodipicolinate reductase, partial [Atribacterota bacterium]